MFGKNKKKRADYDEYEDEYEDEYDDRADDKYDDSYDLINFPVIVQERAYCLFIVFRDRFIHMIDDRAADS